MEINHVMTIGYENYYYVILIEVGNVINRMVLALSLEGDNLIII